MSFDRARDIVHDECVVSERERGEDTNGVTLVCVCARIWHCYIRWCLRHSPHPCKRHTHLASSPVINTMVTIARQAVVDAERALAHGEAVWRDIEERAARLKIEAVEEYSSHLSDDERRLAATLVPTYAPLRPQQLREAELKLSWERARLREAEALEESIAPFIQDLGPNWLDCPIAAPPPTPAHARDVSSGRAYMRTIATYREFLEKMHLHRGDWVTYNDAYKRHVGRRHGKGDDMLHKCWDSCRGFRGTCLWQGEKQENKRRRQE